MGLVHTDQASSYFAAGQGPGGQAYELTPTQPARNRANTPESWWDRVQDGYARAQHRTHPKPLVVTSVLGLAALVGLGLVLRRRRPFLST